MVNSYKLGLQNETEWILSCEVKFEFVSEVREWNKSWVWRWEDEDSEYLLEDLQSETIQRLLDVGFLGEHGPQVGDGGDAHSEQLLHVEQRLLLGLDLGREHLPPGFWLPGRLATDLLSDGHFWDRLTWLSVLFFWELNFVMTSNLGCWAVSVKPACEAR